MTRSRNPAIIFATRSGGTTIDQDAHGGNPFATALIQLANAEGVSFRQFPTRLRALTINGSKRHQVPQWTRWPERLLWSFQLPPGSRQESRCALLLVVSNYSDNGLAPLAGAACDERRLAKMFAAHGFSVVQGIAPCRAALLDALDNFGRQALQHDVAVVYSTGHATEWNGRVYLLPGDYPLVGRGSPARLRTQAISVDRIATACRARRLNFVFFAGCRTLISQGSANKVVNRSRPKRGT
ncbi:MAG: caspase family protein [Nitrospira sp.]